ncbi:hypothetical protein MPER_12571, partial [Moniliophthora perniciosa FA553]
FKRIRLSPSAKAIYNRDVFLVLRVNSLEVPLDPTRTIVLNDSSSGRTYVFYGTETDPTQVTLVIAYSVYNDAALPEDLETFDSILAQYANFQVAGGASEPPSPANEKAGGLSIVPASGPLKNEDMRGHLVLMNEDTGEIVGEVDKRITVREDPHLSEKGHENDPVVIEIPDDASPDGETAIEAFARNVPPDEQNWMTTSASLVSHVISGTTNLLVRVISGASSYYISHSQPSPHHSSTNLARSGDASGASTPPPLPPRALVFLTSEKTRKNLAKVQTVSTQAAKVSGKTIAVIDDMISRAINGKDKQSKGKGTTSTLAAPVPQSGTSSGRTSPAPPPYASQVNLTASGDSKPPLPPRASGSTVPLNRSNSPNPAPPALPPRKLGFKGRIILSADLILSTIDESTKKLINVGADSATAIGQHKYGSEAAKTSTMMGNTARNIGLVYIDVRGVGRKALIKRAGKQYIKSKFSSRHKQAAAQEQAQGKN